MAGGGLFRQSRCSKLPRTLGDHFGALTQGELFLNNLIQGGSAESRPVGGAAASAGELQSGGNSAGPPSPAPVEHLPGVHALRACAALAVFTGHSLDMSALWLPLPKDTVVDIANVFLLGLPLFYIVSAFSLMHSTRGHTGASNWVVNFYLKRFWRIAPMFYTMMIVDSIYSYSVLHIHPSRFEFGLDMLFINNLFPGLTSSAVYAGWSVSVEMLFYLVFPLIVTRLTTIKRGLVFAAAMIFVSEASRIYLDTVHEHFGTYGDWCVVTYLQHFALGTLAYLVAERLRLRWAGAGPPSLRTLFLRHAAFALGLLGLVIVISTFHSELKAFLKIDSTLCAVVFALVVVWFTALRIPGVGWAPIQFLGERSYSLYLVHLLFLYILYGQVFMTRIGTKPAFANIVYHFFQPWLGGWAILPTLVLNYMPITLAATISYALIEKPGMDFGRKIRTMLRKRLASNTMVASSFN